MDTQLIFLDTETTGLNRTGEDRIVEITIINDNCETLINTLVNPEMPIPSDASAVHGITDEMVREYPTLDDLTPGLAAIMTGMTVVIYNKDYDVSFLPESVINAAAKIKCCMDRFAPIYGDWNDYYKNYKWQPLIVAANYVGHDWRGVAAHRALADCIATRAVWRWLDETA